MFDLNLSKHNDKICLITEREQYTYGEVANICSLFEQVLQDDKQLILVKSKTNVETIIGYLSFLRSNQAFIMIDATIEEELIDHIIGTYHPNFIWEERDEKYSYVYKFGSYGLRAYNNSKVSLYPDLSLMLSTSGTTGSPKMVKLTKKNLYANCKSIVEYLNIKSDHRAITNLPLYYSYGLSILNTHLFMGASIVVSDKSVMSKEFWPIFKTNKVTTLNGVPYNYEIFRRIGLTKMDLPSLKYMTQAGGKLNHKLVKEYAQWAKERGILFYVMYGQTEATARISYLPPDKTLEKESSIGVVIPGGKLLIKSLNNHDLVDTPYNDGELIYQGENVMLGYARNYEDLERGDELKGILHTGDVAHKDKDGFFYITGRLKRFIKIHGNRVGLDEVEQFLKSNAYDILCTGIDNKLMIATKEKHKIDEIKHAVLEKYNLHHSVVKVLYIDEYPVASTGKIQYKELIKAF